MSQTLVGGGKWNTLYSACSDLIPFAAIMATTGIIPSPGRQEDKTIQDKTILEGDQEGQHHLYFQGV